MKTNSYVYEQDIYTYDLYAVTCDRCGRAAEFLCSNPPHTQYTAWTVSPLGEDLCPECAAQEQAANDYAVWLDSLYEGAKIR